MHQGESTRQLRFTGHSRTVVYHYGTSCQPSGPQNLEVPPRFLENLWTRVFNHPSCGPYSLYSASYITISSIKYEASLYFRKLLFLILRQVFCVPVLP